MKNILAILSVFIILAFAGMVCAQVNPPQKDNPVQKSSSSQQTEITKTQTTQSTQSAPAAKAATTKPKPPMMVGTVVSVDSVANTIVVKGKKTDVTFDVDPAAKIMMGKKAVKLTELPKDTKVSVVYMMDGTKKVAKSIVQVKVTAPKMRTKTETKTETTSKTETKSETKPVTP